MELVRALSNAAASSTSAHECTALLTMARSHNKAPSDVCGLLVTVTLNKLRDQSQYVTCTGGIHGIDTCRCVLQAM